MWERMVLIKKWTCVVAAAVGLVLAMAVPVRAVSGFKLPLSFWEDTYSYSFIDYNQDGVMEVIVRGMQGKEEPEAKLYTYVDGEVHAFQSAKDNEWFRSPN